MAVTKYPNYLGDQLKLKLKEICQNDASSNFSKDCEEIKFSNVSEECLNVAIQLARRDLKERNFPWDLLVDDGEAFESTTLAQKHKNANNANRYNNAKAPSSAKKYSKRSSLNGPKSHSDIKDLPVRTMSPPTQDGGSRAPSSAARVAKTIFAEVGRLRGDVKKVILQIRTLSCIKAKTNNKLDDDPAEARRRKVRLEERTTRIGRLVYDLCRSTNELVNNAKKNTREESLKKLIHNYKECLRVMKMMMMQMSDCSHPPTFLRSKIFPELIAVLSDLEFSEMELEVERANEDGLSTELKNILIDSGKAATSLVPSSCQPPAAPPPTPASNQDLNNNFVGRQHDRKINSVALPTVANDKISSKEVDDSAGRPKSFHVEMLKNQIGDVPMVVTESGDVESRESLLNRYMRILLGKENMKAGSSAVGGGKSSSKVNPGGRIKTKTVKLTGVSGLIKPGVVKRHRGHLVTKDPYHYARPTLSRMQKSTSYISDAVHFSGGGKFRSLSSPPHHCRRYGDAAAADDDDDDVMSRRGRSVGYSRRSRSLPHRPISSRHQIYFDKNHNLKSRKEKCNPTERFDIKVSQPGDSDVEETDEDVGVMANIEMISKKLGEFEMERKRIKARWSKEMRGREEDSREGREKSWVTEFHEEFKKDVEEAKEVFHPRLESLPSKGFGNNHSANLLQEWERRNREFFSYNLFSGMAKDETATPVNVCNEVQTVEVGRIDPTCIQRAGDANNLSSSTDLVSKIIDVSHLPVNLALNREFVGHLFEQNVAWEKFVKDFADQMVGSNAVSNFDDTFVCRRITKDILGDCLNEVCKEVDVVGNEIMERVYRSELSNRQN